MGSCSWLLGLPKANLTLADWELLGGRICEALLQFRFVVLTAALPRACDLPPIWWTPPERPQWRRRQTHPDDLDVVLTAEQKADVVRLWSQISPPLRPVGGPNAELGPHHQRQTSWASAVCCISVG